MKPLGVTSAASLLLPASFQRREVASAWLQSGLCFGMPSSTREIPPTVPAVAPLPSGHVGHARRATVAIGHRAARAGGRVADRHPGADFFLATRCVVTGTWCVICFGHDFTLRDRNLNHLGAGFVPRLSAPGDKPCRAAQTDSSVRCVSGFHWYSVIGT